MDQQDRVRGVANRSAKDLAGVNEAGVQRADENAVIGDDLVLRIQADDMELLLRRIVDQAMELLTAVCQCLAAAGDASGGLTSSRQFSDAAPQLSRATLVTGPVGTIPLHAIGSCS